MLRTISANEIESKIIEAIRYITFNPDPDIRPALLSALQQETAPLPADILDCMVRNIDIARQQGIPLCQDTGSLIVFAEIGNQVVIDAAPIQTVVNNALAKATELCYLRASIVCDPLFERVNTSNNTPAIVHASIVEGNQLRLQIAQKGGGAENMSRMVMLNPNAGASEVTNFVVETVRLSGSKACPPLIVGVGIGGNFETCALLSKNALYRPLNQAHPDVLYANLEQQILTAVNATSIGVQGMGGNLTALAVHIASAPCHFASLPVAVNLQCHSHRHIEVYI